MYTLVRFLPLRQLLSEQAPTLLISLTIAELAFKFHSFLLETGAFLLTWYAVDGVRSWLAGKLQQSSHRPPSSSQS